LRLKNAPIVEAVLDIDCDMPPGQDVASLETAAREAYQSTYPTFRKIFMREHRLAVDQPPVTTQIVEALQFFQEDNKQLVQVRSKGFSLNRLAPYSSLDDYISEMERTWNIFVRIASPVQVRSVQLRYINRILLPLSLEMRLDDYFKVCPRLPDEDALVFVGFLNQHQAVEQATGNQVNIVLASQPPEEAILPIVFDITATSAGVIQPGNWEAILIKIQSLRDLKNKVFRNTLTRKCIDLFQH
jgi:uncharacterized protein (TIGR04255 family)